MTPEMIQWLTYAGIMLGGYLLRHWGVVPPGTPQTPPQSPGQDQTPAPTIPEAPETILGFLAAIRAQLAQHHVILSRLNQPPQGPGAPGSHSS